ncbi:MAG: metallophosphoesterase [Deltaproteobacteria bacterium]|jgi:putative phosphoesterase|nr:metallophosphoesterase [Deltaproteobacteria bacterium]
MGQFRKDIIRVGVISDSHLRDTAESILLLEGLIESYLQPIDVLLHAGDLIAPGLLDHFEGFPVYAVRGNMDPATTDLPYKRIVQIGPVRIGLIHGWGPAGGLEQAVLNEFSDNRLDCLVYGHTHRPVCHHKGGLLFFNPGSPTDKRGMKYHTVGLLEIAGTEIRGKIIQID